MGQRYILHKLFKIEAHELIFKKHCNINNALAFLWLLFFFFNCRYLVFSLHLGRLGSVAFCNHSLKYCFYEKMLTGFQTANFPKNTGNDGGTISDGCW